jgi:hypothetical protein
MPYKASKEVPSSHSQYPLAVRKLKSSPTINRLGHWPQTAQLVSMIAALQSKNRLFTQKICQFPRKMYGTNFHL